jgi:hypothetical protein
MDNINTNINQIIFPKDMELRKVRKKPKKKAPNKKKIALDNLKSVLANFDAVVNEAKQKNINIPAELGQLPSNINQVDTIKEIEELTNDLTNRIAQIQALIQKGSSLTQAKNLFGYDLPQRAGVFPITPQPFLPPTIIPAREPPVLPSGGERPIIPSGVTPAISDDTEKDLEQIRKEILDKLTPEQRAKAEAELEKEKGKDVDPQPSTTPTNDLNLERNMGVKYGNQTFNMVAPVGFYDLFRRYRQFIENLQFNSIKIKEGFYNIPENKYTGLENQKNNILKSFNTFNSGLNPKQIQYIDNSPTLSEIEKMIDNTLIMDLEDILKQELTKQKVNVTEVSGGKKPSSLEKEEKSNEDFDELLNSTKDKTSELKSQIKDANDPVLLKQIITTLNNKLLVKLNEGYNKLSGEEKTASLTQYNNLKATINDLVSKAQQKITEIESGEEGLNPIIPQPEQPEDPEIPEDPSVVKPDPEPVSPEQPEPVAPDAGDATPLKPRPRPKEPEPLTRDQKILVSYIRNSGKNYVKSQYTAVEKLFGKSQANKIRKEKDTNRKRNLIKNLLLDNGVDPSYFN